MGWRWQMAVLAGWVGVLGCRDEQAGPKSTRAQRVQPVQAPKPAAPQPFVVRRSAGPLALDGIPQEDAWLQANELRLQGSLNGGPVRQATSVRMLYDDTSIYVAFVCEDSDVWGSLRRQDDPIYNEDAVEVFLDADGDGKTYNELQVSPHNVQFDAAFAYRRSDLAAAMTWKSGMESAVAVRGSLDDLSDRDQGWSVEMKIPFKNLIAVPRLPPQPGDTWRFNAYRLDHVVRQQQVEGQSAFPTRAPDFHNLSQFGALTFQ